MKEMRRESGTPETKVPEPECLDSSEGIISKRWAPIHSVRNDISQNVCFTSLRMIVFGKERDNGIAYNKKWSTKIFIDCAEDLKNIEIIFTCSIH